MKNIKYYLIEILKFLNYHWFRDVTEPGMQQAAVMRGMNFVRGRLGNTGFRRQYVSDGNGGYSRQTVAFTMPETNASNTVLQQNQRSKFRQLAVLGGMLNRCGILRRFYYSGLGISGYNAFIRDNIRRDAAIKCDDGKTYIDWPKLLIAIGLPRQIVPYKSELVTGTDYDPSCKVPIHLRWSNKSSKNDDKGDWSLVLVGVPIKEDGSAEEICFVQPGATLETCYADVLLEKCDCCKTYWFAFFANTYTGENTTSIYLGADASTFDTLPSYDPNTCCFNCEEEIVVDANCELPSDEPEFCGCGHDDVDVEASEIVFTGENNYPTFGFSDVDLLDAGVNDGSGVSPSSGSSSSSFDLIGATCPVDFTLQEFDLSPLGGNVNESFANGSDLAARVELLVNDGTWTYNTSDCTIASVDSTNAGGSINSNTTGTAPTSVDSPITNVSCPVDFSVTEFDLTAIGGGVNETFASGADLAIRIEALVNDGTWSYDSSSCIVSSTDTTLSTFDIPGNIPIVTASGCYQSTRSTQTNGDPFFYSGLEINGTYYSFTSDIMIHDAAGITISANLPAVEAEIAALLTSAGYGVAGVSVIDNGDFNSPTINIAIDDNTVTLKIVGSDTGGNYPTDLDPIACSLVIDSAGQML